jgi:hypothetical protein
MAMAEERDWELGRGKHYETNRNGMMGIPMLSPFTTLLLLSFS